MCASARGHLVRRLELMGIEPEICRWAESFMADRNVRIVIDGTERQDGVVETGIPQGSPVSPILFAVYISGVFEEAERKTAPEGLSFVDGVAWVATGKAVEELTAKLEACAAAAGEWAQANAVSFDEGKTEAVLFRKGREEMPAGNRSATTRRPTTRRQHGGWGCISTTRSPLRNITGHRCGKPDRPKAGCDVSPVSLG